MLKNYRELKVWEKAYKLCLDIYYEEGKASGIKRGTRVCRENAKSNDQIPGKQTLETLDPGPLESFLPTNWEKNLTYRRPYVLVCGLIFLWIAMGGSLWAADVTELDTRMQGFEASAETSSPAPEDHTDDILSGFEDDSNAPASSGDSLPESRVSIDGYAKFSSAYNIAHDEPLEDETDWRGFSKLKGSLYLELGARLLADWRVQISAKGSHDAIYDLRGEDEFSDDVVDNYETELTLTETYISGSLTDFLDLKIGRQIVVWGKSDNIRITDVLNPLDLREPGLTDIEELRLPVTMSRIDYYFGNWSLGAFMIHEIRYNQNPEFGSDFYPGDTPPPDEEDPAEGSDESEYALALNGIFSGWDIAFYYADILNDAYHPELISVFPTLEIRLQHDRLALYGAAFNVAWGNWLIKTEMAYLEGFRFFNTEDETFSRIDLLAGLEYSGIRDTSVSLEVANRHLIDFDERLSDDPDEAIEDDTQSVFRLTRSFLNETLSCTLLAICYGTSQADGTLERLSLDYDFNDAVMVRIGVIAYQAGDGRLTGHIEDNDRVYAELKYSF